MLRLRSTLYTQLRRSSLSFSTTSTTPQQRITLTPAQLSSYQRDGYLRVPNFFSNHECQLLLDTIEADATIQSNVMGMVDASGRASKLTLWFHLGDDTYSAFGRSTSLVSAARDLMSLDSDSHTPEEPYHFHTKIMLKEPKIGGQWEWHQDFGYWYAQGLLQPNKCFSSIMAVDNHTKENGCLQVLKGSHKLGRLEHGMYNGQAGVDPSKLKHCLDMYELVHCEMNQGDMLFTHSNLLHASAANNSDDWRRSMIIAYNAKSNSPLEKDSIIPSYNAINVVEDGAIGSWGVQLHDKKRSDFLSMEDNKDSFEQDIEAAATK